MRLNRRRCQGGRRDRPRCTRCKEVLWTELSVWTGEPPDDADAPETAALGHHWMLDAFDCAAHRLGDLALVRDVLTGLPARLGLTVVGEVQLFAPPESEAVAGLVLLSESHFSLHLFPGSGRAHADLFSCRPFDVAAARAFLEDRLGFARAEEVLLRRGGAPGGPR